MDVEIVKMNRIGSILVKVLIGMGVLYFSSCVKNHLLEGNADYPCDNLPDYPMGVVGINQAELQSKAPAFNPMNSDQFVFVEVTGTTTNLVIFNLSSKNKKTVVEDAGVRGQPKWGENGLIAYSDKSFSLIVVDTMGNLKYKIQSSGSFLYPAWQSDSTITAQFSYNLGVPYYRVLVNLNGQITDSIKGPGFHRGIYVSTEKYVSVYYENKTTLIESTPVLSVKQLFDIPFDGRNVITGLAYNHKAKEFYFTTFREGVYVFNPQDGKRLKLLQGCDTRSYDYISISGDCKYLLMERVDAFDYINKNGIYSVKSGIFLYDIAKRELTALTL